MARSNNYDIQSVNTPLYGWGMTLDLTGKGYEVGKRVWDTYEHMLAYVNDPNDSACPGNILAVVGDSDPKKNGVYIVKQAKNVALVDGKVTTNTEVTTSIVEMVGAGSGVETVENYTAAVALAKADNIGSIIYAKTDEAGHPAGSYVVTGEGTLQRLATSSATGSPVESITGDTYVTATKSGADVTLAVDRDAIIDGLVKSQNLGETFDMKIAKENSITYLYLTSKDGKTNYAKVDASSFVADGFLDSVKLDGDNLTFKWNTAAGKTTDTTISLSKYIDVYSAGNGVSIESNVISAKVKKGDKYLTVDVDGIQTKGIDAAITAAVDAKVIPTTSVEGSGMATVTSSTTGNDTKYTVGVTTKNLADATAESDGLAKANDVKTYVSNAIANATIEWESL